MSGQHKNTTISFRISDYERREIEARIKASGMRKKDYFSRSCIYNRICVVGKKEVIYELVECVRNMQEDMHFLAGEVYKNGRIKEKKSPIDGSEYTDMEEIAFDYVAMLNAVIDVLDGAKYLWEPEKQNSPVHKQGL